MYFVRESIPRHEDVIGVPYETGYLKHYQQYNIMCVCFTLAYLFLHCTLKPFVHVFFYKISYL